MEKVELSLYKMIFEASKDGILEEKELEKWCKQNYDRILKWFDNVEEFVKSKCVQAKEIEIKLGEISKRDSLIKCYINDNLHSEALKLIGFKKFLQDFTIINQREPIEVNLWENYLIYAQVLGIADKVSKDFKEMYPDLMKQKYNIEINDLKLLSGLTKTAIRTARAAGSRTSSASYSSGGGGSSGGGSGGGTR